MERDKFDQAAVALVQALITFLAEYRVAPESRRRAALTLISGGLEKMGESVLKEPKIDGLGLKDSGDASSP